MGRGPRRLPPRQRVQFYVSGIQIPRREPPDGDVYPADDLDMRNTLDCVPFLRRRDLDDHLHYISLHRRFLHKLRISPAHVNPPSDHLVHRSDLLLRLRVLRERVAAASAVLLRRRDRAARLRLETVEQSLPSTQATLVLSGRHQIIVASTLSKYIYHSIGSRRKLINFLR